MSGVSDTELAIKFAETAERDFEAAKLLLKNNYCTQAIFMLQQSLEKLIKAILLRVGIVEQEELGEELKHKVLKMARELVHRSLEQAMDLLDPMIKYMLNPENIDHELLNEICKTANNILIFVYGTVKTLKSLITIYEQGSKELEDLAFEPTKEPMDKDDKRLQFLKRINEIRTEIPYPLVGSITEEALKLINNLKGLQKYPDKQSITQLEQNSDTRSVHSTLLNALFLLLPIHTPYELLTSKIRYPHRHKGDIINPQDKCEKSIIKWWTETSINILNDLINPLKNCLKEHVEDEALRKCQEAIRQGLDKLSQITQHTTAHSININREATDRKIYKEL